MNVIVSASTLAATAAFASPRIADPLDPVFRAIELHRRAHAAWRRAFNRQEAIVETQPADISQYPKIAVGKRRIRAGENGLDFHETIFARSARDIDARHEINLALARSVHDTLPTLFAKAKAIQDAWRAEKLAELERELARYREWSDRSGLTAAAATAIAAANLERLAFDRLRRTLPTSLPGMLALMRYAREHDKVLDEDFFAACDDDPTHPGQLLLTLERGLIESCETI